MTNMVWLAVAAAAVQAQGVQLPNPSIFGQSTGEAVRLLVDKKPGDAEPIVIWSDVRCGRYVAATAFYSRPATPALTKAEISTVYGPETLPPSGRWSEENFGTWRMDKRGFSIQLAEEDKLGEKVVVVRYIHASALEQCSDSDAHYVGPQ